MVKRVLSNERLCLVESKGRGTSMLKKIYTLLTLLIASVAVTSCSVKGSQGAIHENTEERILTYKKHSPKKSVSQKPIKPYQQSVYANSFNQKLSNAALGRLRSKVRYDGSYVSIAYPGGDVSPHVGVCTDVIIRSYRKLGIDLQEQVHRDMSAAFNTYPNPRKWGLSKPDTNIDHRRVYNLRNFFQRRGAALPITHNPLNYKPGDLVSWMVGPDLPHIGIVVDKRSKADPNRFMVVHNIAHGPQLEDMLFAFPITGHYRYTPAHMGNIPTKVYTHKKRPLNNSGMSYQQLVQAANILRVNPSNTADVVQAKPQFKTKLNHGTRLNPINNSILKEKDNALTLANLNLSDGAAQLLLNSTTME